MEQDKRHYIFLFGLLLVSILIIIFASNLGTKSRSDAFERPSTMFTDETGARAIFMVLQEFDLDVRQLKTGFLPTHQTTRETLVIMGPSLEPTMTDLKFLEDWIRSGGQLIFAMHESWQRAELFSALGTGDDEPSTDDEDFIQSLGFVPKAMDGESQGPLRVEGYTLEPGSYQVLAQDGDRILAGMVELGLGRVVVVPDSGAWSNERLGDSDNATWLLHRILEYGSTQVYFDEFHHGFSAKRSLTVLIWDFLFSKWGIAFLQLILAFALLIYGPWRRFGKPLKPADEGRYNPLELIEARAGLFRIAEAHELSVDSIHQHLRQVLRTMHIDFEHHQRHSPSLRAYLEKYQALKKRGTHQYQDLAEIAKLSGLVIQEHRHE